MSSKAAPGTGRLSRRKRLFFGLVTVLLFLVCLEPGFRLVFRVAGGDSERLLKARAYYLGRVQGLLEPWPHVMFRMGAGAEEHYREVGGFYSTHPIETPRSGPALRIAFVGGSTTQSGNPEGYLGSFPYYVERLLGQAGVPVEVLNCGTPSWSSAENLIHYHMSIQDYRPDWVVIHHGANDVKARLYPEFRADYSHYRRPFVVPRPGRLQAWLVRRSRFYTWLLTRFREIPTFLVDLADHPLPPPKEWKLHPDGLRVFERNTMNLVHLAEACGARVLLTTESHNRRPEPGTESRDGMREAMEEQNEAIRRIALRRELPLVDTEALLDHHGPEFLDYVHLTPEGNLIKARHVARGLIRAGMRCPSGEAPDETALQELSR